MILLPDESVGKILTKRLAELEAMWPDRKGIAAFEMDVVIGYEFWLAFSWFWFGVAFGWVAAMLVGRHLKLWTR